MRSAIVVTQPFEVRSRLQQLGLDESVLREVAQRALAARSQATASHPRTAAGLYQWLEGVATLRELLIPPPYKFRAEDINNLSLTVSADNITAIIVATGDEGTGLPDQEPCTTSKKGPNTRSAVEQNFYRWLLFPEIVKPEDFLKATSGRTTWLLLLHYDQDSEEMRCELSQPVAMADNDHVKGWSVRIMVPPISFTDPTSAAVPSVEPSPEIDIKVKKRA